MSDRSSIEWTDATWNPIRAMTATPAGPKTGWHCEHVSEGCRNCYAEAFNRRLGTGFDYKPGNLIHENKFGERRGEVSILLDDTMLLQPLKWKKPRKIFVCSMTDLFAEFVSDATIDRVFAAMALCPHHIFQVLTKRPERMRDYLTLKADERDRPTAGFKLGRCGIVWQEAYRVAAHGFGQEALFTQALETRGMPTQDLPWPLANVWLGVSVEDQAAADERIPHLLSTPAAVRWLSCEPLLGPVDLNRIHQTSTDGLSQRWDSALSGSRFDEWGGGPDLNGCPRIDWVVVGGESGRGARPMHPNWARQLRDQSAAGGIPFLFKQWGAYSDAHAEAIGGITSSEGVDQGDVAWPDGTVGNGRAEDHGGPGAILTHWHHKRDAGRLLDGVQHDGYPS